MKLSNSKISALNKEILEANQAPSLDVSPRISSKIEKKEICPDFFGVFAKENIQQGEMIFRNWNDNCTLKTREEVAALPDSYRLFFEKYCTELKEHCYVGPYPNEDIENQLDYFINHSCNPNTWMANDHDVVARRDIQCGEQITIDYATFVVNEFESAKIDPCLCGSYNCRSKVGKDDWWILRDTYRGHYISWIQKKIDQKEKEQA
jgi:SET domain-containing protein